jgi:hypothetical protein
MKSKNQENGRGKKKENSSGEQKHLHIVECGG